MSAMGDARQEVTDVLTELGFSVKDHPSKANNWTVVLGSTDPSMVANPTLGKVPVFDYSLDVHCIGDNPNTSSLTKLEDMVESIAFSLDAEGWNVDNWSAPFPGDSGDNKVFLTITLRISKTIHIEGGN